MYWSMLKFITIIMVYVLLFLTGRDRNWGLSAGSGFPVHSTVHHGQSDGPLHALPHRTHVPEPAAAHSETGEECALCHDASTKVWTTHIGTLVRNELLLQKYITPRFAW